MSGNILFAGTSEFAAQQLQQLYSSGYIVDAVFTQPPKPKGRGRKLIQSPVHDLAEKLSLPAYHPNKLDTEVQQIISSYKPKLMVVVAYGKIVPQAVLDIPEYGCINVHASILPRWRGAAPIERAILAGDSETGIAIMQMDAGLDTGDVLCMASVPIHAHTTAGELENQLAKLGAKLLIEQLPTILLGKVKKTPQQTLDGEPCYAHKITKQDTFLDFNCSGAHLIRQINAFSPKPGAFFLNNQEIIKVWQAEYVMIDSKALPGTILEYSKTALIIQCSDGALKITELQRQGKSRCFIQNFYNGCPNLFKQEEVVR